MKLRININAAFCSLFCLTLFSGCALPVPQGGEAGDFISEKEIVSVEIIREGMEYYDRSRFLEAEGNFRQALYLNPGLSNLRTNLAATLEKTGQYEEAERLYLELLREKREDVNTLSGYARLQLAQRNWSAAIDYFRKAYSAAVFKGDVASQQAIERSIATLSFATGHIDDALCYSSAVYSSTKNKKDLIQYSKILLSAGKFISNSQLLGAAVSELDLANDPEILHQRAVSSYAAGNYAESLEFERRGLFSTELSPELKPQLMVVKISAEKRLGLVSEEDQEEEFFDKISEMAGALFNSGEDALLYWPPNLLEDVGELVRKES